VIITAAALRIDAWRQQHAQPGGGGFQRLDGEFQILVPGARKADDQAIAGQRVGAHALEARDVLHALGVAGAGSQQRDPAGDEHAQPVHSGVIFAKKRASQPCRL
jgi:hypothetical protein